MAKQMKLKVDTGAVTYRIYDADGEEIGKVKFTPTDTGIMERYKEVVKALESVRLDDETATEDQIVELDKKISEQFDYLFGRPVSAGLFAVAKPLTVLKNGDWFFESVFDSLGDVITEAYQERYQAKMAKIEAATKEYTEGEAAVSDPS